MSRLNGLTHGTELGLYDLIADELVPECLTTVCVGVGVLNTAPDRSERCAGEPQALVIEVCKKMRSVGRRYNSGRIIDSLDMMISKPAFSRPSKLATGASTSSNSMYVDPVVHQREPCRLGRRGNIPLAETPEFCIALTVIPTAFIGIINAEMPSRPGFQVRTAAVQ